MGNITIFAGGFGSGKSEVALNQAVKMARFAPDIVLADLDMVNPYFVSRQLKSILEEAGIRLLAPEGELSFSDVPAMPRQILGIIQQDNHMIIDVAGDEVGCLALGYLRKYIIARSGYEFLLVLNPYRPFSQDLPSAQRLMGQLEQSAGLHFTGIVSNPNMMADTDAEIIKSGHEQVKAFSSGVDLPISYLTVEKRFYSLLYPLYGALLEAMELYLKPNWM